MNIHLNSFVVCWFFFFKAKDGMQGVSSCGTQIIY